MNDNSKNNGNAPFFSVVMPLYNKAAHVAYAVSSVLNQTFCDFELIIVNDASTDGSADEVRKYNDPRTCLINRNQPGAGGYAARNLGIEKARGKWIAFLDADDTWYSNHLKKMHELSSIHPEVYFMGCGWLTQIDGKTTEDGYFKDNQSRGIHAVSMKQYLQACLSGKQPVCTIVACVKKTSPVALKLFPANTEAKRGGDLHAWLKIICYHKKMAWSNHLGAIYYRDDINTVTKIAPSSSYLMSKTIYKKLSENLDDEEKVILKKYFNMHLRNAWIGNILRNNQNFKLFTKLYWKGDMFNAIILFITSFIPNRIFKILYYFIRYVKK